jgi:hypothetical protein
MLSNMQFGETNRSDRVTLHEVSVYGKSRLGDDYLKSTQDLAGQ